MEWLTKELLTTYGPLALGWLVAIFLGWYVLYEKRKPNTALELLLAEARKAIENTKEALEASLRREEVHHVVLLDVIKALERLSTLIEERTRR